VGQLHLTEIGQRLPVSRIGADGDRSGSLVSGRPGIRAQGVDERRVQRSRGQGQLEQVLFLVVQLAHRSEHARRSIRCTRGGIRIDEGDGAAGPRDRPGNPQADDPGTDDDDVHSTLSHVVPSAGNRL